MNEKNEEITSSPLPFKINTEKDIIDITPTEEMNFPDAIREVINGKKIFRLEWLDKGFYGFLNGETLSLHKPDGASYKWIISSGDLTAEDWIVIE